MSVLWDNIVYMPTNYLEKYSELVLKSGDILMALNRPILGGKLKIGVLREQDTPAILYQRVGRFDFYDESIKPYFFFYSQSPHFIDILKNSLQGVDQPFVNKPKLLDIPIPLPPLPEQRRIVTKLEELFTRLDAGVSALKKTQAQLKRYHQSVLKAAFEGKLVSTEAELARAEGRTYEPADVLLARILKERREKLSKNAKYKEPAAPDTSGLPALPEGWCWTNVGMISEKIQYGTSEKAEEDNSGIPVLWMGNIQDGKLIFEGLKYFPKQWSELSVFLLQDGDVLFNLNFATCG
jgi:type I restriction enzyme S subunit